MNSKINGMTQEQTQHEEIMSLISKIFYIKEKMKELQDERDGYKNGQIQLQGMVSDLMDVNAKWAGKVKELEKTNNGNLNLIDEWEIKYNELNGFLGKAFAHIEKLENGIAIHKDLELRLQEDKHKNWLDWKQTESRIKVLEEAVDRHEIFKRAHEKVVALEDEALYQKRKEI